MEKNFLTNITQKEGTVFAIKNMWINIGRNVKLFVQDLLYTINIDKLF